MKVQVGSTVLTDMMSIKWHFYINMPTDKKNVAGKCKTPNLRIPVIREAIVTINRNPSFVTIYQKVLAQKQMTFRHKELL